MRISTKSQYGLRALICLAKKDEILPIKKISRKEGISFHYLEKIISKLERAKIVKAKKGASGGYSLALSPAKIKIKDVIEALDGQFISIKCLEKEKSCPNKKNCLAKKFWQKLKESIDKTLNKITLQNLIE